MMSTLLQQLAQSTPSVYLDKGFQLATVLNGSYLQERESLVAIPVDKTVSLQFRGDFIGLLNHEGFPEYLHHFMCLANGVSDPLTYNQVTDALLTYSDTQLAKFAAEYRSLVR